MSIEGFMEKFRFSSRSRYVAVYLNPPFFAWFLVPRFTVSILNLLCYALSGKASMTALGASRSILLITHERGALPCEEGRRDNVVAVACTAL